MRCKLTIGHLGDDKVVVVSLRSRQGPEKKTTFKLANITKELNANVISDESM